MTSNSEWAFDKAYHRPDWHIQKANMQHLHKEQEQCDGNLYTTREFEFSMWIGRS